MTAFTTLLNALFLPGKPILGSTGSALRDNIAASMEGASGATRLHLAALYNPVTGSTIKLRLDAVQSDSTGTYQEVASIGIIQAGTVNIYLEHRITTSSSAESRVRRRRAGSVSTIATYSTSSGSLVAENTDVTVIPGDEIIVEHRRAGISGATEIANIRMRTDPAVNVFPMDNFGYWENM